MKIFGWLFLFGGLGFGYVEVSGLIRQQEFKKNSIVVEGKVIRTAPRTDKWDKPICVRFIVEYQNDGETIQTDGLCQNNAHDNECAKVGDIKKVRFIPNSANSSIQSRYKQINDDGVFQPSQSWSSVMLPVIFVVVGLVLITVLKKKPEPIAYPDK